MVHFFYISSSGAHINSNYRRAFRVTAISNTLESPQRFVTFGILIAAAADSYKLQYESYQQLSCMWQMYYFVNIYFQQCEEGCHAILPVCLCVCWRDNSKSGKMDLDELFWWVKRLLTVAAGYLENSSTVFLWNFWVDGSWNKKDTTRVTFRIDPDPDRKPIRSGLIWIL